MSHLNEFETEFKNQEALIRALCGMGFRRDQIQIHDAAVKLNDYHNSGQYVANIIIRQPATGIRSDIGWEKKTRLNAKKKEEAYFVGHVDSYWGGNGKLYDDIWNTNLLNRYNLECIKITAEAKGKTYTEFKDKLGRVGLRFTRSKNTSPAMKIHS
jgi:hypothetical protein